MNEYTRELQALKPWDAVQTIREAREEFVGREKKLSSDAVSGTFFIGTAGHGYLAVPISHPLIEKARALCSYGFKGSRAVYLEEDCEMGKFLEA